jgi:hypothetical protein
VQVARSLYGTALVSKRIWLALDDCQQHSRAVQGSPRAVQISEKAGLSAQVIR